MSMKPIGDWLVYLAVRVLVCIVQASRLERCYDIARWLAAFAYRVDRRHRVVALDNLRRAFPGRYSEAQLPQIVRGVYEHFACMIVEIAHIPRKLHETNWRRYVKLRGHEQIVDLLLHDRPLIFQTGHFGNWEVGGYVLGLFGFRPYSVARSLDNPYLEGLLRSFRMRTGQRIIYKRGAFDQVDAALQRNSLVAFLSDQDAGPRGVFVEFFGRPASTHKGVALLSLKHSAPVAIGVSCRRGRGLQYELITQTVIDPLRLPHSADPVWSITQRACAALEHIVRAHPEQYLWLHRRWKHQPAPAARAA
jgi:KDO2-lipid IV(A) lauroyltransferase